MEESTRGLLGISRGGDSEGMAFEIQPLSTPNREEILQQIEQQAEEGEEPHSHSQSQSHHLQQDIYIAEFQN